MTAFFQEYFTLALTASVVMLAMFLLRPLLKRLPKRMICLLWVAVLFRLLCPYTVEGPIPAFWRPAQVQDSAAEIPGTDGAFYIGQNGDILDQTINGASDQPGSGGPELLPNGHSKSENSGIFSNGQSETGNPELLPNSQAELENAGALPNGQVQTDVNFLGGDLQQPQQNAYEAGSAASANMPENPGILSNSTQGSANAAGMEETPAETLGMSAETAEILPAGPDLKKLFTYVFGYAWLAGMAAAAALLLWRCVYLRRCLREAFPYREWQGYPVKTSDLKGLPIVFGLFHPCIYVPLGFAEAQDPGEELILNHELMHIQRKDIWLKFLLCIAFCIHWWNPLMWISVYLLQQDVEMACDEAVLAKIGASEQKLYAQTLLNYAAKQSGLVLPLAFGESNTQKRVKNILNYKKLPFWGIAAGILVVCILGICIATKPHDRKPKEPENLGSSQEENITAPEEELPEGYRWIASEDELLTIALDHWNELYTEENILSADGKIEPYRIRGPIFYEAKHENDIIWYHWKCYGYGISKDFKLTEYFTDIPCFKKDGKLYAGAPEDTVYEEIGSASQAIGMELPFGTWYNSDMDRSGDWYQWDMVIEVLAERIRQSAPEKYELLKNPESAVEFLFHLQSGTPTLYGNSVLWSFDDSGSNRILFTMEQLGDIWYPAAMRVDGQEPEYFEVDVDTALSSLEERQNYLAGISAEQLREVTPVIEAFTGDTLEGLNYDEFLALSEIPGEDVTLYGNVGGDLLVLRLQDKICLLETWWQSMHGVIPQVFSGDYDRDGETEYAVKIFVKTGTGYSVDDLFIVEQPVYNSAGEEIVPFQVHQFQERNWMREMSRITWEYQEKEKLLWVTADGKSCNVSLKAFLDIYQADSAGEQEIFKELSWGDISSFECSADNQWFLNVIGGIRTSFTGVQPTYEVSVEFLSPVEYHEDGTFTLGNIQMEGKIYNENLTNLYDDSHEEMVINRIRDQVDVNGDGREDVIVISVDKPQGYEGTWQELMDGYGLCHVRVYDGSWDIYDEKTYAATGGYNIRAAIWEDELCVSHAGNGMIALCEKNGSYYLLRSNASCYQGVYSYEYMVYGFMQASGRSYQADSGHLDNIEPGRTVAYDLSDLPMEDMVNYTMALDGWLQNSIFLAYADVDDGWRVRVYGGETYEATEIWKCLGVEKRVKQWMEQLCGLPKKEEQPGQLKFMQENPWIADYLPKITTLIDVQPTPYGAGDQRQYFLYRLANKRYLVSVREACWQGVWEYHYTVYNLKAAPGENETVDTGAVYVSATVPEDTFPVSEMVDYTEKLAGWLQDSMLLATAAGDETAQKQLVTWTDGTNSFEAWESWKGLAEDVNRRIFEMQAASDLSGKVRFPEDKPLTGMEDLSAVLQNLNARYAVWGSCILEQTNK